MKFMKSKRATKGTGPRIHCTASEMEANPDEIPIIQFARLTRAGGGSVIPLPLASSVICVIAQSGNKIRPNPEQA